MGEEEGTIRFGLRLPASLHDALLKQAREHHRSLNSEIVSLLSLLIDGGSLAQGLIEERVAAKIDGLRIDANESLRSIAERLFREILPQLPPEIKEQVVTLERAAALRDKMFASFTQEVFRKLIVEEQLKKIQGK
jgi:hypothetical protein